MQAQDRLHWSTEQGEVIEKDGIRITPESRSLTIRWPNGRLVWNRPLAVVVDRGGTTERIPIVDVTRWIVWGAAGFAALVFLLGGILSRRK